MHVKVVLFCGGLGTRLREHSETIPKPLVNVGGRPILWHLMKYYAHFGHREFVLCLGYRGDLIRQFFINYDPRDSDDFVMSNGVSEVASHGSDVPDWRIHFVDTGLNSNIGQRLMAVRSIVAGEEMFLANYSDQLSNLDLDRYVEWFRGRQAVAGFVSVKPSQSFHLVEKNDDGVVVGMEAVTNTETWINGGYLVLRSEIFDYMRAGEELVEQPFARLIAKRALVTYPYTGFWKAMDTFKDKLSYDQMDARGERPWIIWS
jgi:glucose-1-phosphate cytidylyltransferase